MYHVRFVVCDHKADISLGCHPGHGMCWMYVDRRKERIDPLPVTPRGNTCILLFTGSFSRRADMFAVTAAEFTAEGTANILINRYIPLWGCPRSILSDNGLQFCSKLLHAVYKLLEVRKIATSSYHPNDIGGVERLNHKMAHMLAMVVDEFQNNCEEQLSLTSNLRTQVWSTLPPV